MGRILVADDEQGVREFLSEALEGDGHDVDQAEDGEAAMHKLLARGYDLVITDLKMPRRDGMALLHWLRAEQPDVEIVLLTAHGSIQTAVEAMKLGAFDYLQKPVGSPAELRLIAARALERRQLRTFRDHTKRSSDETEPTLTWHAPAMRPVVDALGKVAATNASVLLIGESGTGKEVAARAIHRTSPRADGPFVAVNCAALTDSLLESELFGHEKGAFTGAHALRRGRLELASGGTFFLDEIGELEPHLQAKLLRVLQERQFERVGGERTLTADVRWVAATNRDIGEMLAEGTFRDDLYHRLAVFPLHLPALRERREDIRPLAHELLRTISAEIGKPARHITEAAACHLETASWPGNIRELRNVLERAVIVGESDTIELKHLWLDAAIRPATSIVLPQGTLAELERAAIEQALRATNRNRKLTAERLGIGLRTLYEKLKRYQLS